MAEKKFDTKFTIQFNRTNPEHMRAVEILNNLRRRGKAQYIVGAVLHYERCAENPKAGYSRATDEKSIEAVVFRILRDRNVATDMPSIDIPGELMEMPSIGEKSFDNAEETLGEVERSAVAGVLEMFRKR